MIRFCFRSDLGVSLKACGKTHALIRYKADGRREKRVCEDIHNAGAFADAVCGVDAPEVRNSSNLPSCPPFSLVLPFH